MRPSNRFLFLGLLAAIFLVFALRAGWKVFFFSLAGSLLSFSLTLVWNILKNSPEAVQTKDVSPSEKPVPTSREEKPVFIPGRNFEEILERLGSNESMINVILNSMGEGVLLLNQADRIVLMNPSAEKILATPQKDAIGRHYLEVVRHPVLADLLTRSRTMGGAAGSEIEFSGREEKTFTVSVAAIQMEGKHHLGQIVVFSDITSMKRLMRMRTEFVANVSHELKTPLTAILGYVETLLSGALDDKKNRVQFLQKISDQAHRLHALITDVLELSKIESGAALEALEAVELSDVVQQVADLLRAKLEARSITLALEVPVGERVQAQKESLTHVVENLIDNAIKYSPGKSKVRVFSNKREDGRVGLSVVDEGPGIPLDAQSRVFERFFRVDASRSREAGGTGLGLSIVKHLVEKMNGEVSLQSQEGKGSTFTVVLSSATQ